MELPCSASRVVMKPILNEDVICCRRFTLSCGEASVV
jgi:hypothetical protein